MHELYELKEMLCKELEEIGGKGELSAGSLETVDTLAHALKNVNKIIEDKEEDGYSNRYHDGTSYARGRMNVTRDSRGRYSRRGGSYARNGRMRGGYSRDDEADKMVTKLEKMMNEASDQNVKNAIEQAIDAIEM